MASDGERQSGFRRGRAQVDAPDPHRDRCDHDRPKLLTAAERLQYESYLRREETNAAILALSKNGIPIKQIVRQTGHSRKLVRLVVRGERHDVFRTRQSSLDPHLPWLDEQWAGLNFGVV